MLHLFIRKKTISEKCEIMYRANSFINKNYFYHNRVDDKNISEFDMLKSLNENNKY